MNKETINKIKNKLQGDVNKLNMQHKITLEAINDFSNLVNYIAENNILSPHETDNYFRDEKVLQTVEKCIALSMRYELLFENIAYEYLTSSLNQRRTQQNSQEDQKWVKAFKIVSEKHMAFYKDMVSREIELGEINYKSRICHIGIGKMPLSLLVLHKASNGCHITGIDKLAYAIAGAKKCILSRNKKYPGLFEEKSIPLYVSDGSNFDYSEFDVIIFSTSVSGKLAILEKIFASAKPSVKLLERSPYGLAPYLYVYEKMPKSFKMQAQSTSFSRLIATRQYNICRYKICR